MPYKNTKKLKEYFKKYYQEHKEKIKKQSENYYKNNKDKVREYFKNNKMKNKNLAEEYFKILKRNPKTKMTWDKFFDKFKIPKKARTDFGVACILNQYNQLCEKMKQRKIEFKIWDTELKKMFYSYDNLLKCEGELWSLWTITTKNKLKLLTNSNKGKLLQFTGLKDKNEKEIYEGDIVKFNNIDLDLINKGEVVFKDGMFKVKTKNKERFILECCYVGFKVEVIGNIYENPKIYTKLNKKGF